MNYQNADNPAPPGAANPNGGSAAGVCTPLEPLVLEQLYDRWAQPILRYLQRLAGRAGSAEDLFQETWVQALRHLDTLRDPERAGPWLYRIAHNLAINDLKQRRCRGRFWVTLEDPADEGGLAQTDPLTRVPDPTAVTDRQAMDHETQKILGEALGRLDDETQTMIRLKYFEQLTLAEVAMVLDMPPGTVAARIHRALRQVRQYLRRHGFAGVTAFQ